MTTLSNSAIAERPQFPVEDDGFSFEFPGMTPGQEYTVKLLLADIRTRQNRETLLSIHANGAMMLRHGAIISAAGTADGPARVSFVCPADETGQIQLTFSSGFSHAHILGIEILTGRHLPPAEPTGVIAFAGHSHVSLRWEPVPGATSYIVKRRPVTHGHLVTVATGVTTPEYTDLMVGRDEVFQYVVIAVNAMGEGDPTRPVTAHPPFRLTITPQTVDVSPGRNATCAVVAVVTGSVDGAIVLSASGMTAGVSAWFDKAKLGIPTYEGQEVQVIDRLNIAAGVTSRLGRHEMCVHANAGDYTASAIVTLNVA